jgi:hypothetical protein
MIITPIIVRVELLLPLYKIWWIEVSKGARGEFTSAKRQEF